ncbi:MAG: hypothetical protein COA32_09065 [Fluviicola sp.]|nr:MAG: hypothetical protein COA32_09065 [Fluviicola sp.]
MYFILLIPFCFLLSNSSFGQSDTTEVEGKWILFGHESSDSLVDHKSYTGYHISYYRDSLKHSEGYYFDDQRTGVWIYYFEEGETKAMITYRNNKPYGLYKEYYQNGYLKDSSYLDGSLNKIINSCVRYYENGGVAFQASYNNNHKEEGTVLYYYENGQIEVDYNAKNGIPVGKMTRFSENGEIKEIVIFNEKGEVIKSIVDP